MTEEELTMNILELNLGGTTSVTHTMTWILLILVKFPDIQEKIYKEISEVDPSGSILTYEERVTKTPYTAAFVDEALVIVALDLFFCFCLFGNKRDIFITKFSIPVSI